MAIDSLSRPIFHMYIFMFPLLIQKVYNYMILLGLCKLENEILKKAKIFSAKRSFLSVFFLFSKFHFPACTTLDIIYIILNDIIYLNCAEVKINLNVYQISVIIKKLI